MNYRTLASSIERLRGLLEKRPTDLTEKNRVYWDEWNRRVKAELKKTRTATQTRHAYSVYYETPYDGRAMVDIGTFGSDEAARKAAIKLLKKDKTYLRLTPITLVRRVSTYSTGESYEETVG
jgi:hypothetical protein